MPDGPPQTWRHPTTGDTWILRPDDTGMVHLDLRVVQLILQAGGYYERESAPAAGVPAHAPDQGLADDWMHEGW